MVGKTISHYKILEKLGEGGMGVVYKAEDTKLERIVALKFLSLTSIGDEEKKRFKREAKAAASLNHPNIATIFAIDEADDQTFIAMEYIEGKSLEELVGANGGKPMPIDKAIDYATQTAAGLQAAHEKGITHRDIKSANIMVTDKDQIKIMDFGLAKLANRSKLTQLGTTLGTAAYMSPEQSRGENTDHRADIWSLGVVLYEMISGQMPFKGDYEQAVIYSIQNEEPEPLTALRTGVPIALDGIIAKALAKDKATRYQNVEELPADLKGIDKASLSRSRISTVTQPLQGFQPSKKSILTKVLVPLAIVTALAAGWLGSRLFTSPELPIPLTASLNFEEDAGPVSFFALSPDGTQLAYTPRSSFEGGRLRIRNLADGSTRPLPGTEGAERPFWSPEGTMLGYFAEEKLRVVPAKGGPSIALAPAPRPYGGTWNDQGVILYNPAYGPLFQVPAAGGPSARVTQLRYQGELHRTPVFLPDGRHFLFSVPNLRDDRIIIYKGDLETGEFEQVREGGNPAYVESGFLVFRLSNDLTVASLFAQRFDPGSGTLSGQPLPVLSNFRTPGGNAQLSVTRRTIVFVPSQKGQQNLPVLMGRNGEILDSLAHREGGWRHQFSHDGKRVAIVGQELWVHDLTRKISERIPTEVTFPYPYAWASDDASIVYSSARTSGQLRRVAVAGTTREETIFQSDEGAIVFIDCSPDGRTVLLVYAADQTRTHSELWACDVEKGTASRLLEGSFNIFKARFAPNGKWYAYTSDEGRNDSDVYLRPFPGPGAAIRVSAEGGSSPRWREDGKELFYLNGERQVVAVQVAFEGGPSLAPAGDVIAYPGFYFLAVHPDGQRFLMRPEEETRSGSQLTILRNWIGMLEERK